MADVTTGSTQEYNITNNQLQIFATIGNDISVESCLDARERTCGEPV